MIQRPAASADEFWEIGLNSVLKSALGWGLEGYMDAIIQHSKWGLDGLLNFVKYFVEESEGRFEGKIGDADGEEVSGGICVRYQRNQTL